jgi:hypothetical protein
MNKELNRFLRKALILYFPNPGGFNVDAILVIGGAIVWGVCAIYSQVWGVVMIPEVSEIGKACIFVGIGRATKGDVTADLEKKPDTQP